MEFDYQTDSETSRNDEAHFICASELNWRGNAK